MEDLVIPLPPEILEHIQSLMNAREAARSAILSKYLYNSWSKRPNLDFDSRYFRFKSNRFLAFTKNTLQRYEDSKLKIDTFTLGVFPELHSHAAELIAWATKLGALDIRIEFFCGFWDFILPELIFESETLTRFSVTGCIIDLQSRAEVTRSNLKSLHLSCVEIIDGDLLRNLILRFPSLDEVVCEYASPGYGFYKLGNSLSLKSLRNIDSLFFETVFLKFPSLKKLCIRYIYDCQNIRIHSESLESISLVEYNRAVTFDFDVPNLRKFHFEGSALSCLALTPPCRDWESDICIMCYQASASWLSSLRKLLTNFSLSKVSLSVHVKFPSRYVCDYTTTTNEHIPALENLKIVNHAPNAGLLGGLFLICRPKLVSQHCFAPGSNDLLKLLCNKFVDQRCENCCIPNPSMHGLEEVNVECFEESLAVWRPLPWKTLFYASTDPENSQQFRFRLRWQAG